MLASRQQDGHLGFGALLALLVAPIGLIAFGFFPVLAVAVIPVVAWVALFALAAGLIRSSHD